MTRTTLTAHAIDDVLAGTFPASDPPSWTPGMARPALADTIDVSPPAHAPRTFTQGLGSLLGAVAVVLIAPLAILAVGAPVALGVRGLLEAAAWVLAAVR
jgi:hypothetical protein